MFVKFVLGKKLDKLLVMQCPLVRKLQSANCPLGYDEIRYGRFVLNFRNVFNFGVISIRAEIQFCPVQLSLKSLEDVGY